MTTFNTPAQMLCPGTKTNTKIWFKVKKKLTFSHYLFVWFDSLRPINNLSVTYGWIFLGWTSTELGLMCLAQWHKAVTPVRLKPVTPGLESSILSLSHCTSSPWNISNYPFKNGITVEKSIECCIEWHWLISKFCRPFLFSFQISLTQSSQSILEPKDEWTLNQDWWTPNQDQWTLKQDWWTLNEDWRTLNRSWWTLTQIW